MLRLEFLKQQEQVADMQMLREFIHKLGTHKPPSFHQLHVHHRKNTISLHIPCQYFSSIRQKLFYIGIIVTTLEKLVHWAV